MRLGLDFHIDLLTTPHDAVPLAASLLPHECDSLPESLESGPLARAVQHSRVNREMKPPADVIVIDDDDDSEDGAVEDDTRRAEEAGRSFFGRGSDAERSMRDDAFFDARRGTGDGASEEAGGAQGLDGDGDGDEDVEFVGRTPRKETGDDYVPLNGMFGVSHGDLGPQPPATGPTMPRRNEHGAGGGLFRGPGPLGRDDKEFHDDDVDDDVDDDDDDDVEFVDTAQGWE